MSAENQVLPLPFTGAPLLRVSHEVDYVGVHLNLKADWASHVAARHLFPQWFTGG